MSHANDSLSAGTQVPSSPEATRHRTALWRDPRLVVGVALVAVSALLGAVLLGGGEAGSGVWAARVAMVEGQSVAAQDLVRREVRFADPADRERYLSADQQPPDAAVLARDVGAGELVPLAALDAGSPQAVVELPLAVPAEGVPATVRRGSVVDVWVTPDPALDPVLAGDDGAAGPSRSALVLGRVRVLQVSREGGALGPRATRQVVVGVSPAQEKALPEALARLAHGSVVLVRRP